VVILALRWAARSIGTGRIVCFGHQLVGLRQRTGILTATVMNRVDAYRMIRRRTADAGFKVKLGCHVFRATGSSIQAPAPAVDGCVPKVRFAADSPVEEEGFEPSVPPVTGTTVPRSTAPAPLRAVAE
jgi:hypothetical protein